MLAMDASSRTTPVEIRQSSPTQLSIRWADGVESLYAVRELRLACACALCVDEWTGENKLDAGEIPADVRPVRINSVGRYAIGIDWTDGHETGIYAFDTLRALANGEGAELG
ncbi:MAG: DUF971 domain-containing protein [Myxococcota bacterium]|jgi:ATP-binding protein involved in chromosome partitioning|nr:DUF971 domain-containing protein [Myxococcota bacterium]